MYYNLHTHHLPTDNNEIAIINRNPDEDLCADASAIGKNVYSIGLHPWHVDANWQEKIEAVRSMAQQQNVWAIGECGLDKVRGGDFQLQKEAFRAQLEIARKVGKPVIVHCVKAFDELLSMTDKGNKIVVHGFRGKPQQAKQIMAKGMLLSFGQLYNVETLKFVYATNLPFFLETDDLRLSVHQIYDQVALHLGVDAYHLVRLCDPRQICGRLP